MTKVEAVKLVAVAVSCFPTQQERNMEPTCDAWFEMLGDLDYNHALMALKKVLATAKFFPTVAEIREAAASLKPQDVPEAEEAWGEFVKAVKTVGYMRTPQWSHPVIGEAVARMYGSWQRACETLQIETMGVDRKHFTGIYQTLTKRQREAALLPPAVQEFAQLAAGTLKALPGGAERRIGGG